MKILVKIVLIIVVLLIAIGYYFKNINNPKGDILVGIGILILAFILMPLFIYSRYRKKKLKSFIYKHEKNRII
ncbi:MAG: hypothetical protein L3J23_03880 [Flavobacteriaceae bacterium]|nr:hypothetical protein [Flavobacteriaceae bacterium]